jgi:hypothetical protein
VKIASHQCSTFAGTTPPSIPCHMSPQPPVRVPCSPPSLPPSLPTVSRPFPVAPPVLSPSPFLAPLPDGQQDSNFCSDCGSDSVACALVERGGGGKGER